MRDGQPGASRQPRPQPRQESRQRNAGSREEHDHHQTTGRTPQPEPKNHQTMAEFPSDGSDWALANTGVITGSQITSLSIQGFHNGTPIGSWDLSSGYAGFTFNFNFDTTAMTFPQGGLSTGPDGQDWNVAMGGISCPSPGFGFSSGSGGQALCVDSALVYDSFRYLAFTLQAVEASVPGAAPEPGTLALAAAGALALLGLRRATRK